MAPPKQRFIFLSLFIIVSVVIFLLWAVWKNQHPRCKNCNVIVISLDQVRAKSLPCFGYSQNTTPNLCRFADSSHVFTNAYATASRTLDSHFSMITSLYPSTHTMNVPYASVLPQEIPTLAEILKGTGYQTYFMGPEGDPHLPLTKGLERGFDKTYKADSPVKWKETMQKIASTSGNLEKPSFFFLHTYDAHEPYTPFEDYLARFYQGPIKIQINYDNLCSFTINKLKRLHPEKFITIRNQETPCNQLDTYAMSQVTSSDEYNDTYAIFNTYYWSLLDSLSRQEQQTYAHALYAAQMYMLDEALGDFFEYLKQSGMLDNSVIIIVGDQGDEFFEHGSYSHGWSLYEEVLHVPFIIYVPNSGTGRSTKLVSLVDIMPTVLRVVGAKIPTTLAGIDVFSRLRHAMILSEHPSDGAVALRTNQYTLIRRIVEGAFQLELYDRKSDLDEQHNIFEGNTTIVESLLRQYKTLQSEFPKFTNTPNPLPTWLGEEDRKRLIESGYF